MKRTLPIAFLLLAPFAAAQYGMRRLPPVQAVASTPDVPLSTPDPAFPLRVHLFTARWGGFNSRNHGYGTGNLLKAGAVQGFDYAFECDYPFVENQDPAASYQARWKKEPYELEILTQQVDGSHGHTCKLHLALETRPFDPANVAYFTHGVSSSLRVRWQEPDFAYEQPDPDYPVQFHVVDGLRREDAYGDHGWGMANLFAPGPGATLQGADYRYDCAYGFLTSTQVNNFYQGHWVKNDEKLELLLQRPGSDKVDKCTVSVILHPQPYPNPVSRAQRSSTEPVLIRPASTNR